MDFFKNCKTVAEAKSTFRKLAKRYHPDLNPSEDTTAIMQEVNNQFQAFKPAELAFGSEGEKFEASAAQWSQIVVELLKLEGVEFEVIGSWIWITKSTKELAPAIKAINFEGKKFDQYKRPLWHAKKKCWYISPKGYRKFSGQGYSLDQVRELYGSNKFKAPSKKRLK